MSEQPRPNVFINSVLKRGALVAETVDATAQRQKRRHTKSRQGCVACKLRKIKCDERKPCSRCVKRGIECKPPPNKDGAPGQAALSICSEVSSQTQMNLLQLELFHHWDKHTRSTLVFPEIWPVIMQQAFHEPFIMAAILCTSALHLTTLSPQSVRYSYYATTLMTKTISLFRQNLSRPLSKKTSEANMGTALLINYISWCDLSFMDGVRNSTCLVHDQLLFLSPGILHVWFQTIPIFIEEKSVFLKVTNRNPRLEIEHALNKRGLNGKLFVKPLMDVWDDPRYQRSQNLPTHTSVHEPAIKGSWHLLQALQRELVPANPRLGRPACHSDDHEPLPEQMMDYKKAIAKVMAASMEAKDSLIPPTGPPSALDRAAFEYIVRRMSPLLVCQTTASNSDQGIASDMLALHENIEDFIYGVPVLCCGPFTELVARRDTRALVLLFHFYRCARTLLDPRRGWWARARCCIMEELIGKELKSLGLNIYLGNFNGKE